MPRWAPALPLKASPAAETTTPPPGLPPAAPSPAAQIYAVNNAGNVIKSGSDGSGAYTDLGAPPSWWATSPYLEYRSG